MTSDGAFVGANEKEPVFVRRIFEERALQILDILERYPCHIRVWNEEYALGNKVKQKNQLIAKMTIGVGDPLFYPIHFVDSVCEQIMENPFAPLKIQAQFFDDLEQQRALSQLQQATKGAHIISPAQGRIECVAQGVSKARSLQRLGNHLQISANEMVAIGAEDYDIDMLQQVGLGVAMGNATKQVKEAADWVTRSIEQNGVAYMIKEVFRKQMRINV
ncbi:HAD hydrolase family protein [Bacillus sp. JCM 19034]|uniref:HAD hydrolase family protein n=1 Tax=Bacillus sp. JCM 19034 TaxID=1481928 RepID=UPI0022B1150C|nr:HAD hydrolase family protein [Bacillus sp. JCM 19034]